MKKLVVCPGKFSGLGLSIGLIALFSGSTVVAGDLDADRDEARALAMAFGSSLQAVLKPAMKESGPVAAIEVCNLQAPEIARSQATSSGWKIGRTSLRVRNPANRADAWELSVLKEFEARKAAGESLKQLESMEVVEQDGLTRFRYMKAIPTGKVCLSCHGTQLQPPVVSRINELYPLDQATGFEMGDIRGAFTLSKTLP